MDNFSNLMVVGECLLDVRRTKAFIRAIDSTVKPGDIVVDAGTGSGILAMAAARAGAKKVYAIEIDEGIAEMAKKNLDQNNLEGLVTVISGDIKELVIPESANVVVMEMLDTGLIAEQQVPAINHLIETKIITKSTIVIPRKVNTYVEFADYDFDFHDFNMPMIIQARNFSTIRRIRNRISNKIKIAELDLSKVNKRHIVNKIKSKSKQSGRINSLVITSMIKLTEKSHLWGTTDMNMPVVVPIPARKVSKNTEIEFEISYILSEGFNTISFKWL